MTDNSIQIKKDLEMFLYQLRIDAEVYVEEMVRLFILLTDTQDCTFKILMEIYGLFSVRIIYTVSQKTWCRIFAITSSNVNRF